MKKYYTPSIEEFHVGFEYESHEDPRIEDGWEKQVTDRHSIKYPLNEDSDVDYRVKYLDREDIESLDFVYNGTSIDIWFNKDGNFEIGSWTSYKISLHYGLEDHRLFIDAMDEGKKVSIFQGIIKNKSEFKKILTQLNVLK